MFNNEVDITLDYADGRAMFALNHGKWQMRTKDTLTGETSDVRTLTPHEAACILFLFVDGGDGDDEMGKRAYEVAEPKVEGLKSALRPIP